MRGLPPEEMRGQTVGMFYAESWGLFHYLYKTDRAGLEKCCVVFGTRGIQRMPLESQRKLFTEAFGEDMAGLEGRWLGYVNDLPPRPVGN